MKPKIALIAHDFPPYNVGGSQRPYLMAKALATAGFNVVVFTLFEKHYSKEKLNFEYEFKKFNNIKIIRTDIKIKDKKKRKESHYLNLVDDIGGRWFAYLTSAIESEHAIEKFNLFLVTSPPFSVAKIALKLSKNFNLPFIFDMRDAWSQWILAPYASYFHYWLTKRLERRVLKKAKFVLHVSNQQLNDLKGIHKNVDFSKFLYVPNCFVDFKSTSSDQNGEKLRIVYTGSFYYNPYSQSLQNLPWYKKKWYQWLQYLPRKEDWSYRSPIYFFKILNEIRNKDNNFLKNIEVVFAGDKPDWFDYEVQKMNLECCIKHLGFISKKEIEELLHTADYLLITSSKVVGGREYSAAGKTFEYMSFLKPLIGVVCEGEQKDLLSKMGSAIILNPDNVAESAEKLTGNLKITTPLKPNLDFYSNFRFPNNFNPLIKELKNI